MRHGKAPNGKQRFRCRDCGRTSRENLGSAAYPETRNQEIPAAYHERSSLRGLVRIFGISRTTVSTWLKKARHLPPLAQTLAPATADEPEVLELDELWSFVRYKKNKRWIWLALCRRTRQVVAYAIGDRSEATYRLLWSRVPPAYRRGLFYSNFWESYQTVLPDDQHQPVDKSTGETNHVERWNLTLRQRLGRFVL
jgi:IS1 family transposase